MRPNEYVLMERCVEEGINLGWNRAHKHTDTPDEHQIKDAIHNAIMLHISENWIFDEVYDETV